MIKNNWRSAPLSEVLEPVSRPETVNRLKTYRVLGMRWYAQGLFVKEDRLGAQIQATELFRVEKGDYVYNRLFAWKGSFGIVDDATSGGFVSGEFPCFRVKTDKAEPEFIHFWLSQEPVWNEIARVSSGQTNISRLRLKAPAFLALEIPLPPLDEQRRIVARIEALAGRVAEAQRLRREAVYETEMLYFSELNQFRCKLFLDNHPIKKIGNITLVTAGGTPARDNPLYWGGDIPWIKTGELLDGDIYSSDEYITWEGLENSSAKLFPPETILIALYGQGQTRGRTGRLLIEGATNQACCAILPALDILEPRFTQYWLRSLYYEMRNNSHGGAQPNWNGGMIKNIEISLPSLVQQRRWIQYLDNLNAEIVKLRHLQDHTQKELAALLPSILDQAFKGAL